MNETITFQLNRKPVSLATDANRTLLWVLRADLGLTGTKYGCGIGHCGACTVLVNHEPQRACLLSLGDVKGQEVTTIEGLAQDNQLHPLQQAFVNHSAMQCGFCTPGMILQAYGLLATNPMPTEAEVIRHMDNNLCRCGTHPRMVKAIVAAAQAMKGGAQ
jgi:aerobic-type carbon monoxide dehydrogenase small subunit (CoxS/CutS family)